MCDYFWQRMDQNNQGDLADIFGSSGAFTADDSWQLPADPAIAFGPPTNIFEDDPFSDLEGPLLDELASASFFSSSETEGKGSFFSRMLQISPATGKMLPEVSAPPPLDSAGGSQIASAKLQGMKRRKSQIKKVVCIPAPAVSCKPNGSGEVVPSDLWAWRKYGQKPIKGSPYPRGYYRCSSSKGCSARKQVERSRTDPNMLVITYTSEHNHPWPTQRNALAGSTRSQPSKSNNASSSRSSPHNISQSISIKEEHKECSTSTVFQVVKRDDAYDMEKALVDSQNNHDFDHVFDDSFMLSNSSHPIDFFSNLAELESTDPLNSIYPMEFMGDHKLGEEGGRHKAIDNFYMLDWGDGSSLEQAKRGL